MQPASCLKLKSSFSPKTRVGVVCGGFSSERSISLKSGAAIVNALRRSGRAVTSLDPKRKNFLRQLQAIDVAFLALHGQGGEDGTIQKLLDVRRIPYTGSGVRASRIAFDKIATKRLLVKRGLPTASYTVIRWGDADLKRKILRVGFPCFIKPPCEGSSIGVMPIAKWSQKTEIQLMRLLSRYRVLLVEKGLMGREFTVGIVGAKALPVVEVRPRAEFYDFKAKYTSGMTEYIVPAKISALLRKRLSAIALRSHKALNLRDFSRVDMKLDAKGNPFVLEINSIPGFTQFSLLPKAAQAAGLSFETLCDRLIAFALRRSRNKVL